VEISQVGLLMGVIFVVTWMENLLILVSIRGEIYDQDTQSKL